jgi:hypothetical protein
MKALRFSSNVHKKKLETIEKQHEHLQQELELAKHNAKEDEYKF